jgi:hypothetical protein
MKNWEWMGIKTKGATHSYFVCLELHKQFSSYLAAVTIAGDRTANLDRYLALLAVRVLLHLL